MYSSSYSWPLQEGYIACRHLYLATSLESTLHGYFLPLCLFYTDATTPPGDMYTYDFVYITM